MQNREKPREPLQKVAVSIGPESWVCRSPTRLTEKGGIDLLFAIVTEALLIVWLTYQLVRVIAENRELLDRDNR